MSNNNWMPEDLRNEWDKAKADAEAARQQVENTYDPAQWTDAQHDAYANLVDSAREKSRTGQRMSKEERQALKEYLKNPEGKQAEARNKVQNSVWDFLLSTQEEQKSNTSSVDDAINDTDWS